MIAGLDLAARLAATTCPTFVVAGAEDGNAPVSARQRIADLIPTAGLHALPGVGYFPPLEAPAAFNDLPPSRPQRVADAMRGFPFNSL